MKIKRFSFFFAASRVQLHIMQKNLIQSRALTPSVDSKSNNFEIIFATAT